MAERLNIICIYGEDISPDLGCYGVAVHTPHIDALAAGGTRFTHCYATAPVCSPSRSAIITGRYQTRIGAHQHRSRRDEPLPAAVPLVMDRFRAAGYFTANSGSPAPADRCRGKTDWNFLNRPDAFDGIDYSERAPGQPFYQQYNFTVSHRVFTRDPEHPVDPATVDLPPYYPDHPIARADWAEYLESIQNLDKLVGRVLARLRGDGLLDSTIILFHADHGRAHVRCKQFCYDGGIHIPLIVHGPGIPAGVVDDRLVSGVDLMPTALSLAGLPVPDGLDGRVCIGPQAGSPRDHIIACRDRCDEADDRIRAVRDRRWKYIRNFAPERPYMQFSFYKYMEYPVWTLMKHLHAQGRLAPAVQPFLAATRPPEELYDLQADPHELHNLAADPAHAAERDRLRGLLDYWIRDTHDQGEIPEDPAVAAHWDRHAAEAHARGMAGRGLSTTISDADYLDWWRDHLRAHGWNL